MAKKKEFAIISAFNIFSEGLKLYFQHLDKLIGYMTFPVLGQLAGIVLIFSTVYFFSGNVERIISINPAFNNISMIMILFLVLIIPSFMLFFAAFWKYMVAMGAINSMANNMISSAKLEDLSIHNDTVNRRMPTFLGLLLILSLIGLFFCNPFLIVIFFILMIYLCLVFQIFALEENLNTIEIFKKSIQLVKGNFAKTAYVLILLYLVTYSFLPELINYALEKATIYNYICVPIKAFCQLLPIEETQELVQGILTAINPAYSFEINVNKIANSIATMITATVIIGYTLPLRSICCTLLYKNLETKKLKEKKIKEL